MGGGLLTRATHTIRAAAAAAQAGRGLAAPPPAGSRVRTRARAARLPRALRYAPAPPRAAHVHIHACRLALSCGSWVAAAVGFTRRSLTRGRARGDFSHKAFFLSLFFFLFRKTDFYPFPLLASRFNSSWAARAAAAALKFIFPPGRGFRIRLVVSTSCCCCAQGGKGEQLREARKGFPM